MSLISMVDDWIRKQVAKSECDSCAVTDNDDVVAVQMMGELTIGPLLDQLDRFGGRLATVVASDRDGTALKAVIVVSGQPETDDILAAIHAVEAAWEVARENEEGEDTVSDEGVK